MNENNDFRLLVGILLIAIGSAILAVVITLGVMK